MSSFGTVINLGDNSLKFGPIETLAGPKGTVTRFRCWSPNITLLVAYYNYIVTFGANVRMVGVDAGKDREMEVEVPGLTTSNAGILSELFFDQWELLTNESSDSIFANPLIVNGSPPVLNYNDKCVLSRAALTGDNIQQAVADCNNDITNGNLVAPTVGSGPLGGGVSNGTSIIFQKPGVSSGTDIYGGTAPMQLYLEIKKGQTEYEKPTYVLRHTSYCSPGSTYNTSTANTQKIYTTAALLSEVGSGWTYNLPNRLYSKINGIPVEFAALMESPYYTWGWLKKITREPQLVNFMIEVSTEYELALWSNLRYALR